jgi:hypothetical protein
MPRKSDADRFAELQQKKLSLTEQMRPIASRLSAKNRREATRRKILIGAAVMQAHAKGEVTALSQLLDRYVHRPSDRKLLADLLSAKDC